MANLAEQAGYLRGAADMLEAAPRHSLSGSLCVVMDESYAARFIDNIRKAADAIDEAIAVPVVEPKPQPKEFVPFQEQLYVGR